MLQHCRSCFDNDVFLEASEEYLVDIDENNRSPQHFCDYWLKFKRLVRGENLSEETFIMISQYGSENINSIGKAQATGQIYCR